MANKDKVFKVYEIIAEWFDEHRSRELFEKPYLDTIIKYLAPKATILDLGCGMGEPIAQYFIAQGFEVTGVDGSEKLIALAQQRLPSAKFLVGDMRKIQFGQKFDCIIAWHSFFHLSADDQRKMFPIFVSHLNLGGILAFTSGPSAGEVWSMNGGQNLYHASLDLDEYQTLLAQHGFDLLFHALQDSECGDATIWIAYLKN